MAKLRVGLVGLGAVAQVVHLPVLAGLGDVFEVVAGCDVSEPFAREVAARYAIPHAYGSQDQMLAAESLDIVAVLNSDEYHAESTIAALEAGCHVLLEKPACLTLRELEAMIAARDRAGKEVMVGYMRRHAGAYQELLAAMPPLADIRHVAVRDIIGPNSYFIDQTTKVIVPGDPPTAARADKAARAAALVREAIGDAAEPVVNAFRLLCGLSSHDMSALRGLVGAPQRVIAASSRANGRFISAMLDYGSFTATYECGMDKVGRFDAYIEIFAGERRLRLEYDTPYIRHLPTRLHTTWSEGEQLSRLESRPSFRDPYTAQWQTFHEIIAGRQPLRETLEDAAHDIRLAIDIIAALDR